MDESPWVALAAAKKPVAVIYDIDSTVSSVAHRLGFLEQNPKDWASWNGYMVLDAPIDDVVNTAKEWRRKGVPIIMLTMRPERMREPTLKWLQDNGIPFDELHMRPPNDYTNATERKRLTWLEEIADRYDILLAYDDNPKVIEMWQQQGIPTQLVIDPQSPPLPGDPVPDPKYDFVAEKRPIPKQIEGQGTLFPDEKPYVPMPGDDWVGGTPQTKLDLMTQGGSGEGTNAPIRPQRLYEAADEMIEPKDVTPTRHDQTTPEFMPRVMGKVLIPAYIRMDPRYGIVKVDSHLRELSRVDRLKVKLGRGQNDS